MILTKTASYPWSKLSLKPVCCIPETFIEASDLTFSYDGKIAFESVSIKISKGCITALVGPSGCGKTSFLTTLNRLCDQIPNTKVSGRLLLEGQDILDKTLNVVELRKKVGMLFQKPNPFPMSIKKNLTLPLIEHEKKITPQEIEMRVQTVLESVGLWHEVKDRLNTSALSLSGGQQQRLCLARVMILDPHVILMDEPCSALDPISSGVVEDLIFSLRGKLTVIIVTHNLAQARRVSDSTAVFWTEQSIGRLVEYGDTESIFLNPKNPITNAYIGGARG